MAFSQNLAADALSADISNTDTIIGITMPRLTSKGQVTIPKRVRDHLGLKAGSEVEFVLATDGCIAMRTKAKRPKSDFAAIRGTLRLGMTTDEFMHFLRGDPEE